MTHFENVIAALKGISASEVIMLEGAIRRTQALGKRVLTCGNGGSAATAMHFAADLRLVGVDAWDLLSPAKLTQLGNDEGYESVFNDQAKWADLLIAFSCSGVSPSVKEALTSSDFLLTSRLCPQETIPCYLIIAPSVDYQVIEDVHLAICHAVMKALM